MTRIDTSFMVTVTREEVDTLVRALEREYDKLKYPEEGCPMECDRLKSVRALRNEFADLIGKHYTGIDA